MPGANSPVTEDNKQLGHGKPGDAGPGAKTDAEQRPELAGKGKDDDKDQPGKKEGVSQAAIDAAQDSADKLASENGQSRKEVETGGKAA